MENKYPARIKIYLKHNDEQKIKDIKSKLEKLYTGSTVNINVRKM